MEKHHSTFPVYWTLSSSIDALSMGIIQNKRNGFHTDDCYERMHHLTQILTEHMEAVRNPISFVVLYLREIWDWRWKGDVTGW